MHNSKVNPFIGGYKYTQVGKFGDFRLKSPFISECEIGRWLLYNVNRKSWVTDRKDDNDWVKRFITWEVEGIRQRGRLKKTFGAVGLC